MKILIVDDDATNRLVLRGMLERDNYEVISAENGLDAVEMFREQRPDMVLMDIMMPVMDGYEAARIIKHESENSFVPVIFLTALSGDEALVNCIENGGDDFLRKPYNRTILQSKIAALSRIRDLYSTVQKQNLRLQAFQEHTLGEHEVAEKILQNVVSRDSLDLSSIVRTVRLSAETFNGDIVLSAHNPSGGISVLVGDFTGHGLAAAIGAVPVADVFYKMTAKGYGIEDIVPEINSKLRQLLPVGRFLAACLLSVDNQFRTLQIWNGGLPDVLVTRGAGEGIVKRIISSKVPLGVVGPVALDRYPEIIEILPGDRIHVFTDGVIETVNKDGRMFGQENTERFILEAVERGDYASDNMQQALDTYRGSAQQVDDITYAEFLCEPELLMKKGGVALPDIDKMATSWEVQLDLNYDALKSTDPLPALLQIISEIQGMESHRAHLFTILSELYNNALEHGVLKLDSALKNSAEGFAKYYQEREKRLRQLTEGGLRIELRNEPTAEGGALEIIVRDSGEGFDVSQMSHIEVDFEDKSGRGLSLVQALCASLEFYEEGSCVRAQYPWKAL